MAKRRKFNNWAAIRACTSAHLEVNESDRSRTLPSPVIGNLPNEYDPLCPVGNDAVQPADLPIIIEHFNLGV